MTDTRYSAEELRKMATGLAAGFAGDALRQAARDAETLAGIRAWLTPQQGQPVTLFDEGWIQCVQAALAELDRLSRGDA